MGTRVALETRSAENYGGIAKFDNTERVFVSPGQFISLAVTGTWVNEANSNVPSLATDDAGSTNLFVVPLPVAFSDLAVRGSVVDRGVKIIGCEVIYQVAASDIAAVGLVLYKNEFAAIGTPTATLIASTQTFDAGDATGLTSVLHRISATIAAGNRFFLDAGTTVHAVFNATDGTASDVNILGAVWHLERTLA